MHKYIIRRIIFIVPTLFAISVLIFLFIRLIPGDVIDVQLGITMGVSPEQLEALRRYYGLDKPMHEQYLTWLYSAFRGDMGISIRTGRPVIEEILSRLPVTLELTVAATLVGLTIGIPLGIFSATRCNTPADVAVRVFGLLGLSVPNFWLGVLLILLFSRYFRWMPNTAAYVDILSDWTKHLAQIFFPAITLGAAMAAQVARQTRSSVLDILTEDYIRTARAKGLSERAVLLRHCLRNALIVITTVVGMQMGYLLGGTIVVEQIYCLPGIGRLIMNAISQRDYALVQATALLIALNFVIINLVTDILYAFVDPRVGYE